MKKLSSLLTLMGLIGLLGMACTSPSADGDTLATQVAATVFAEQTAQAIASADTPPSTDVTDTPAPTPTSGKPPTPTATPTPTGPALAKSQVLNLSIRGLESIDPADYFPYTVDQIVSEVFVGLTRQNEETSEVEPGMALSWEVSNNARLWTFHLRDDVPWVRYDPSTRKVEQVKDDRDQMRHVTAQDFVYGIERLLSPDLDSPHASALYLIEGAEDYHTGSGAADSLGVRALDETTLEITLTRPAGYLDAFVGYAMFVAAPEWQIEAEGEDWTEPGAFQSYGPYTLKNWSPDGFLTLVVNPYWPATENIPQPIIEEINWTVMESEVVMAAFQAGDLDIAEVPTDQLDAVRHDPLLTVQPGGCVSFVGFNTQAAPFDDPRVRQAFSLALDRQALIDEATRGNERPAYGLIPPEMRAAPASVERPEPSAIFDPKTARELLAQAYPDLAQLPAITFSHPNTGQHPVVAQATQELWADLLGVRVSLEPLSWGDFFDRLNTDAPQIWRLSWCGPDYADAHGFYRSLFFESEEFSVSNWTNWPGEEFEALLTNAEKLTGVDLRTMLYVDAEEVLLQDQAPIVPLYWHSRNVLTQPYVQRTFSQLGSIERLEKWKLLDPESLPPVTRAPTPTPQPTRTRPPTPTIGPTSTPSPTPCLPHAGFVTDVTVPDGIQFQPGERFTKTWRIQSDGCAAWPAGATWGFVSGEQMGAPTSVPVPETPLGGTADISVEMVAPDTPSTYKSTWQMQDPDGTPFGDPAYVEIVVEWPPPRQLDTGTVIKQTGALNGEGELTVENGLDLDAVAVLTHMDDTTLIAVYIQRGASYTLSGIPDGTYKLFFTLGEDWDAEKAGFTRKKRLSRFEDPFPFSTSATTYTVWSVTLHPVTGGSAGTDPVPEGEFPDLN